MRNFKKILIVICVLSLLAVGCAVWALANDGEEETNIGSVSGLSALITTAEKETDTEAKYKAVMAVADYLDTKVIDTSAEGYNEAILRANAVAVEAADIYLDMIPAEVDGSVDVDGLADIFMYANDVLGAFDIPDGTAGFTAVKVKYDTALYNLSNVLVKDIGTDIANQENPDTAANRAKLNRANAIITYCTPYGENTALDDIKTKYAECVAAHEAAVAKLLGKLDDNNDVTSYDLPIYYQEDWEKKTVGYSTGAITGWSYVANGALANRVGIKAEPDGNKYYVHEYREKEKPAGSFVQRTLAGYTSENGIVIEFDIASFMDVPEQGITVETGSINGRFPSCYLHINGKGDFCSSNKSTVLLKGAYVKGGWYHIIIALDPERFVYKIYVEGQYIGEYFAGFDDSTRFDHTNAALRLSGGASTNGDVCYDNFKIYAGSNYRDENRIENMSDEQKFLYYVNYFTTAANPVLGKKEAYDKAELVIRKFCSVNTETGEYTVFDEYKDNKEITDAINSFASFDIDQLIAIAKSTNVRTYVGLVQNLANVERSYNSVATRKNLVDEINAFIKKNSALMDVTLDEFSANSSDQETPNGVYDYDEYNALFNKLLKQIDYDESSETFVKYMQRFERATALSAAERYYGFAKALIDNDLIDTTLILVESTPGRNNFQSLIEAYDTYINSHVKINEVTKTNNAKRIVQCMNMINHYRTEEQWEINADLINEYLNIVKAVVLGKDADGNLLYDTTYEGIDEAVRFFNRVHAYFYAKEQNAHDEYISYILGLISATDDYVEKIGLVALVDRYVDTNDIDYNDPRMIAHLNNLETCKSELELRGEDYSKLLHQNSVYFVNYVEKMRTARTYAEQVEYYEKAALLYFSLDTTVEGAVAAIDVFDQYEEKLRIIEESSVRFLEAMSIYRACTTKQDQYAALVDCYYNAQFAELSYEGVAAAMAEYQAAYDAHMSYATAVNNDITVTGNAVASFRANSGVVTIIAIIIKKIYGV